jgi:fructose-specific phosphotransferase system IIA component/fructose-specific phosphotransferase system IIB component
VKYNISGKDDYMDILSIKNIYLNLTCEDRDDALKQMSKKIVDLGYAKDSNKVFDYFIERENQISTGLENGFAIPHAKGTGISQAGIFFVRFTKPLEWESLDDSKITDAIFFCIPENGGSEYLQKLALIAQALSSKEFRDKIKSENKEANILAMLNNALIEEEKNTKDKKANSDKTIVAVVACPAGLAHTYMAKKALEVAAEKLNINAFVEAHGAMGIENKIPNSKINSADVVILATDVAVDTEGRFDSLETYQCSTNDVIKNAESVIKNAMALTNGKVKKANTQSDTDFDLQNTEIKGKNKFTRFMKW